MYDTPFYFWQNAASIHQAPLVRELSWITNSPVTVVLDAGLSDDRRRQGWDLVDYGEAAVLRRPMQETRAALMAAAPRNAVHIFSGLFSYEGVGGALRLGLAKGSRVWIQTEPWDPRGLRGRLRRAAYWRRAQPYVRNRVEVLLATGWLAERQFRSIGFTREQIRPWGYFPDTGEAKAPVPVHQPPWRAVYIGQLEARKGVDRLLNALSTIAGDWRLVVIGDGSRRLSLERLAIDLGIEDRVRWCGVLSNADAMDMVARSDTLVLPSRFDGWGAVVNEALLLGLNAVVSDAAGASALAESLPVFAFRSGSKNQFVMALEGARRDAMACSDREQRIREAAVRISPHVAAKYLCDLAAGGVVGAPWER